MVVPVPPSVLYSSEWMRDLGGGRCSGWEHPSYCSGIAIDDEGHDVDVMVCLFVPCRYPGKPQP
jgi:hypothetical protein